MKVFLLVSMALWAANAGIDVYRMARGERCLVSLATALVITLASGALVLA